MRYSRILLPVALGTAALGCAESTTLDLFECGEGGTLPVVGYAGALYDTHAHLEEVETAASIECQMSRNGVTHALAFVTVDPAKPAASEARVREQLGDFPGTFVPFMVLDPRSTSDMSQERIDAVLAGREALFRGVGEVAMYRNPWQQSTLADAPWPKVFAYAAQKSVFLMLHPRADQLQDFRAAVAANPQTRVLLHGPEFPDALPALLRDHPNVYYTLDTATMLSYSAITPRFGGLQFNLGGSAEFVRVYDEHRDAIVAEAVARWAPVVAAAPDRVMWGTDVALDWHFEAAVYARMIDFSRRFVAELPEEQRAGFAHENARRVLGAGSL